MRSTNILIVSIACVALSGCTIPISKHTLTDASNSTIDERLLGTWEVDLRSLNKRMGNRDGQASVVYVIERAPDKANTLLAQPLKDGQPSGVAFPLFTTHMAMRDFLSLGEISGEDSEPCAILLYDMTGADHVQLYLMDGTFVANQIAAGKIKGQDGRAPDGELRSAAITDSPENLRRWVIRSGEKLFDMDRPLSCVRIKPLIAQE